MPKESIEQRSYTIRPQVVLYLEFLPMDGPNPSWGHFEAFHTGNRRAGVDVR